MSDSQPASADRAVFLSYASQDAEAARRICAALRAAGVEVWFDQSELRGGDAWDAKIRKQIKECALFVPIISANTQARLEGYFRIEWRLAAERTHAMAAGRPFLLPVVTDGTADAAAHVPNEFKDVQWTRLPNDETSRMFVRRVQALLKSGLVSGGAGQNGEKALFVEQNAGDRIGHYKLLERVGEGGCGIVWMAEQEYPIKRRVALKIIKLGMDTKEVIARFEAERQALAMMDHPNIAKVYDAGATDTGRPYFVMELVRGVSITEFCDQHRLKSAHRLELVIKVCQAIQHAHQKGIIHRDLKPTNILVSVNDGEAVPKVIDFGIAKATHSRLTDQTVYTAFHQFVGTPAYMSPEQAEMSNVDIDTRSDIYSLGVLLYELLTGDTPFDRRALGEGVDAIRDRIRNAEPERPSAHVRTLAADRRSTVARQRGMAPTELSTLLSGDLDWIVMRCLEKDRARRYETANGLALDLGRYLRNEPIAARPPSTIYQIRKLIRRHRAWFTAATTVAVALVIGAVVSTWQAVRATRAEREQRQLRLQEADLRREIQAHALAARKIAYASDMNAVQQALAVNNIGRARMLLSRQKPAPGHQDLRGWEWRYLWQSCRSEAVATLGEKSHPISSLSVSHDGTWLAAGEDAGGGLTLWNLETKKAMPVPAGIGRVRVAFAPRESLLAIAILADTAPMHRVILWNTSVREVVRELPLAGGCVGLAFSTDGQTLVTSTEGAKNEIQFWRVADGTSVARHAAPTRGNSQWNAFSLSPDGRLAAHTMPDHGLRVIDVTTGREQWTAKAAEEELLAIAFSPDGKTLATGAGFLESAIRLWDTRTGQELGRLEGHRGFIANLVFWPDGRMLASASGDQTIRIWDLPTRKSIQTLRGHKLEVWRLALTPDGKTLISGSKDGVVHLWDVEKPSSASDGAMVVAEGVETWQFVPQSDDDALIVVTADGTVTHRRGRRFQHITPLMDLGPGNSLLFANDVPLLAVRSPQGVIRIWDWKKRKVSAEVAVGPGSVEPIAFLDRGGRLLLMSGSGHQKVIREWDLAAGSEVCSAPVNSPLPDQFRSAVRGDGRQVIVFRPDGNHGQMDFKAGAERPIALNIRDNIRGVFSPDGRLLAASSTLGYARIWNTATWKEEATLAGFMLAVNTVHFAPDGHRLVTASRGSEAVRLWEVGTYEMLLTLEMPGMSAGRLGFSPSGNVIGAVTGGPQKLYLWRAPSMEEIAQAERAVVP